MFRRIKREITAFLICFSIGAGSCSYDGSFLDANAQDPKEYAADEKPLEEYRQLLLGMYGHAKELAEAFLLSGNEEYSSACLEKAGEASRLYHELLQKMKESTNGTEK